MVENVLALRMQMNATLDAAEIPASFAVGRDEALRIVRESGPPTVLVTNVDLGERLSGYSLAHDLRLQSPELPALFISATRWDVVRGIVGKRDHFLEKPFEPATFLAALREMLPYGSIGATRPQRA